ncbi:hypothetical protein [uncultured Gammaproteobacteria bacterium]|nr:hypothetical protein [uncultured Gammaproteobacteria bacterium]
MVLPYNLRIYHHIGGLEKKQILITNFGIIYHHIGGLEKFRMS